MRGIVGLVRLVTVLVGGGIAVAFTLAALGPRIAAVYNANVSTVADINLGELALRTVVYDKNGDEFDVLYGEQNRELVALSDVSEEMISAVIAVEDEGFYDHNGIDAKAIGRAFIRNVNAGGIEEGGSTITQQLIKNGVVGDDQVIDRKVAEAAVARRLEQQLTKAEILEAYLNTVYFGGGAYGVGAAAEIYFGTTPDQLDYPQAALLAGLISNPSAYDPTLHPDAALERRDLALGRLVAVGKITEEEALVHGAVPVPTTRVLPSEWQPDNYFIEEVRRQLLDDPRLGITAEARAEALFGGGLRVYTTYDPAAQAAAEAARDRFASDDERVFVSASASVEPGTGKVRALVGGPGFEVPGFGEFNIATQKGRPTGSSFKPFVLAAAMEKGLVPSDQINGSGPCEFDNPGGFPDPYTADNFSGGGGGVATIRSQTLSSSNCAFVRLGQIVGLSNVADTARALGITSDLSSEPISMPLGPLDITPLDMATAYATFANDGLQVDPIFIERVEDRLGNVVLANEPNPQRAISVQSARLVTSLLEANVRSGTGTGAQLPDQVAAGKTGTGQDFKNAWFVGYTPYLSTAVWMGNPFGQGEETRMTDVSVPELGVRNITGGSAPAAIWQAFNEVYHAGLEPLAFAEPAPTRAGERIRTDDEPVSRGRRAVSPCGDAGAEVDEDDDGIVDACEDSDFVYDPRVGRCPPLLVPIDTDDDGTIDDCAPPTTTPTTTTTEPGETTTTSTTSTSTSTTTTTTTTTLPPATTTS